MTDEFLHYDCNDPKEAFMSSCLGCVHEFRTKQGTLVVYDTTTLTNELGIEYEDTATQTFFFKTFGQEELPCEHFGDVASWGPLGILTQQTPIPHIVVRWRDGWSGGIGEFRLSVPQGNAELSDSDAVKELKVQKEILQAVGRRRYGVLSNLVKKAEAIVN
jgi:hypothetical protein